MKIGGGFVMLCFKARLCIPPDALFLSVGKLSSSQGRQTKRMINVMEEEGEIMKVENLSPSGGLCSLPGMCCQSESLLSPYLST